MKFSNRWYDILKYIATIALPALATFYGGLGVLWGIAYTTEVVGTITLTDTLLGTLLVISNAKYQAEESQ